MMGRWITFMPRSRARQRFLPKSRKAARGGHMVAFPQDVRDHLQSHTPMRRVSAGGDLSRAHDR
jgi:hypothetical protein